MSYLPVSEVDSAHIFVSSWYLIWRSDRFFRLKNVLGHTFDFEFYVCELKQMAVSKLEDFEALHRIYNSNK